MAGFDNSGQTDYRYLPVRRIALFIEEGLRRGLQFAVFEPNDAPLWGQIRLAAGSFMNGLFRQGAFAGNNSSDAFFVKCDAETTTPSDQALGFVNVAVGAVASCGIRRHHAATEDGTGSDLNARWFERIGDTHGTIYTQQSH